MAEYHHKGCYLYLRFAFGIIGVIIGFMGCLCFGVIYKNYYCSALALVSGILALITFVMHLMVWRDVLYSTPAGRFVCLKLLGIIASVFGFAVFVGFLVKGIMVHETGVQLHGWFIVTVWGWMTWKWGFLLFWYAKNYLKALNEIRHDALPINNDDDVCHA